MSQTETILLIVLGFSLASVIALFIGRMLWSMALRLGARRMQRQVPSSLVGLQTERDRLRAEYAMLAQRLGSRLEEAKLALAEQMAEVSRHRNRLEAMEKNYGGRDQELEHLRRRVASLEESLEGSVMREAELRQTLAAKEDALRKMLRKRTDGVWVSTPQAAHQASPPPGKAAESPLVANPEERLRQRIERLNEMAHAKAEPAPPEAKTSPEAVPDTVIMEKLEAAERRTGELRRELEQLDAEWTHRIEGSKPEAEGHAQPGPVANVISLANRIRDLKKGLPTS
jgi:DNA repair exonuclease SbcCD ATPase subunit